MKNLLFLFFVLSSLVSFTQSNLDSSKISDLQVIGDSETFIYQNFNSDTLKVFVSEDSQIIIYDNSGKTVAKQSIEKGLSKIPLSVRSSVYIVEIYDSKSINTFKIKN
jgi:hypothetical protein